MSARSRGRWLGALAGAVLGGAALLAGCQSQFPDLHLTIATGSTEGVYYQMGSELATAWAGQLEIPRPKVVGTAGGPANVQLLLNGAADIGFGSADAIPDPNHGPRKLRALARIYDDYIQVVARADANITDLSELATRSVSIGADGSQTQLVADHLLAAAHVGGVRAVHDSLNDSIAAMKAGRIDAFFWSGGLPTPSITALARTIPIRLLDLGADPSDVLSTMQSRYPVYGEAVVPAGTYGARAPVTTLVVPDFLLVTDRMSDDVAEALVRGLFNAVNQLAGVNSAALAIDIHTAIYTDPVPLHPGAEAYYRSAKV